jgi:hypothetical protein
METTISSGCDSQLRPWAREWAKSLKDAFSLKVDKSAPFQSRVCPQTQILTNEVFDHPPNVYSREIWPSIGPQDCITSFYMHHYNRWPFFEYCTRTSFSHLASCLNTEHQYSDVQWSSDNMVDEESWMAQYGLYGGEWSIMNMMKICLMVRIWMYCWTVP